MTNAVACVAAQTEWAPEPEQVPAREGWIEVPSARLWYWDTGGNGAPVVLLHAANGSAANWGYQQPVFAAAGLRVIAYSRRGHYRSKALAGSEATSPVADLEALRSALGLERFHLLGTAAGGGIAVEYGLTYPERLLSLVVANSLVGLKDAEYQAETRLLVPDGFDRLPADFRELGASYRLANPTGRRRWQELEQKARWADQSSPFTAGRVEPVALRAMPAPALLITGDADPFMPAERLRRLVVQFGQASGLIIAEAGHSCYWEQPLAFNRAVLDHFSRS